MSLRIERILDLSHPIDDATPVYPGDPVVHIEPATTIAGDGFNVQRVRMGSQTGTHIDSAYHFLADGDRVEQLDLLRLCGPAVVADVRGRSPRSPIRWDDLASVADRLGPGVMLVLHTDWSRYWGTPAYHDHPYLDGDAAAEVVRRGVRTVGIDAMSIDETVAAADHPSGFAAHFAVLGVGGVVAENLTNLAAIDFADPIISLLPILLRGADGAPVRAVAMQVLA
jgi:kynurenine formamidase